MRTQQRWSIAMTIVLAATVVAAAGCGGSVPKAAAPDTDIPATDINRTDRDRLADGGTLRWPLLEFPKQWNYLHLNGPGVASAAVIDAVMPTLWTFDESGVPRTDPDYLASAEVTETEPKQVVTYRLNPEATWSDGRAITWKTFKSQWNALKGEDQRYQISASQGYNQIESVERGDGNREVVVTYARPYGDWQSMFSPLLPPDLTGDPATFNTGWLNDIPITAGPFELEGIDEAAGKVTLTRNEDWWGRKPKLDRIVFRSMETDEATDAFAKGDLDFLTVGTNAAAYKRVKSTPETDIRKAAARDFTVITFNGTADHLADVKVRRAVAQGIDRGAIATSALQAVEWPAVPMNNHFFVNTQQGYRDNAGDLGTADPENAGRLLDKAGWTLDDEGRRMKDGEQLTLRFVIPADSPRSAQVGELVQEQLAEIGVKVELPAVPLDDYFSEYIAVGNFDLGPSAWSGTPFPVSSSRSLYVQPTAGPNGALQIQQNFSRIGSKELNERMDAAIAELDPAKARELANQADQMIWEDVHSLALYQQPEIIAASRSLANFGAFGLSSVHYEDIGFVK